MRAHTLFPCCRERFRRPKNPETQNENVSFLAEAQYLDVRPNGTASWQSHNSPDILRTNETTPPRWALDAGPRGGVFASIDAHLPGASLSMVHEHTEETGELYLRVAFRLGRMANKDWHTQTPVFCIRPQGVDGAPHDAAIYLHPKADYLFYISAEWIASDGTLIRIETPEIVRQYDSWRYVDCRLYLPADSYGYMNVHLDGSSSPRWGAMSPTYETDPHGFKDTPGPKLIKWGNTDTSDAVNMASHCPIQPTRLGIGNMIKYALPH